MAQVVIAALADLPDGRGTPVHAGGRALAVFRLGEAVFALDDRCSHRGFPLHDGTLRGDALRCRTHGACFDLASGTVVQGPARRAVRTYPVSVVEGVVSVEID